MALTLLSGALWAVSGTVAAFTGIASAAAQDSLTATATASDDTLKVEKDGVCPFDDPALQYSYYFQTAITKFNAGDEKAAYDLLTQCRELQPDRAETYFYLSKYYSQQGNDSLHVAMMRQAASLDPENTTYKEALLPVCLRSNDIEGAISLIEDIVRAAPDRSDMLNVLLQIYEYKKDFEQVIKTISRIEVADGESDELTLAKIQAYTSLGDDRRVQREFESLIRQHPLDNEYRVMYGNFWLGRGKKKEAYRQYATVLKDEPDNENALISMMDYYRAEGNDSLAVRQRNTLLLSPKTQQATKMLLLRQYIRASEQAMTDSTEVIALLDRMLSQPQPDTQVIEMKLAYMHLKNFPRESMKAVLTEILTSQPDHVQARSELISMAWEDKDAPEMVRLAQPALQYNPGEWSFRYFLAVGHFLADDYDNCIAACLNAIENIDDKVTKELHSELYNLLGDAYHSVGKRSESYDAYEKCLEVDPDKVACLNNYAYYLSEEGGDLDRAAAMSLKTVKAEPSNATYLDTYAWILYLLDRYEEAKIYIDLAVRNLDPDIDNTVIIEHQKAIDAKLKK